MEKIEYTVKRTLRKTVAISIDAEGKVLVKAPMKLSLSFIDGFVSSKKDWIAKTLQKIENNAEERKKSVLESVRFLGKVYPIKFTSASTVSFNGKYFLLPRGEKQEQMHKISEWMRREAKEILDFRVDHYSRIMHVGAKSVKISNAKTRWGSCSSLQNLNFSWKLLFASGRAVDYVVVHELAHLMEMNHSNRFWNIVESNVPDYRSAQQELKQLQADLQKEGWQS